MRPSLSRKGETMSECLLELKGIYKSFGGVKALQDIYLQVFAGEVLCLAGENGCGKSTLIKIISGFTDRIRAVFS